MLPALLFVCLFFATAYGGSRCPARADIYPCTCFNMPIGKKRFYTVVSCNSIRDTEELRSVFESLRNLQMEQFFLYDSFWKTARLQGAERDNNQKLPSDWITNLSVSEFNVVDTTLTPCFACESSRDCRNDVTRRFAAVNSSSSDKICSLCDRPDSKYSWIGCMKKLRYLEFSYGKLTAVRNDFLPMALRELQVLNFTHNEISKFESRVFRNLPDLRSLDLSHNALRDVDSMFTATAVKLQFLDLSHNMIKTVGENLFTNVRSLRALKLRNNEINALEEKDWKRHPVNLTFIDLTSNPINCDCDMRWVNSTFHMNVVMMGLCASPEEFTQTPFRRASRFLIERCNDKGEIGVRPPNQRQRASTSARS